MAKLDPLGWDSSGKRAREAQYGTRNPPGVTAGLAGAQSSGHSCGGISAAAGSPASVFARCSGHGNWAKGHVHVRSARVTRNRVGAVLCRAAVEQRRRSAGVRVLAAGVATAYRNRRKKDQGGNVVLTEGLNWRMLQYRMAGVEIRQRRSTELVGEVVAGRLRASDPHERVLHHDAKPRRWSARLGGHRRRGNSTARWLT